MSYTIALTNDTTADLAGLSITDHLPAGFAYLSGSSALRVDGGLISVADPAVSGGQLTWAPGNLRAAQADWFYGMHTFIQDACDNSHIDAQLAAARDLMGAGAFVKQLFYGIHTKTSGPRDCWVYFVNRAYDLNLQPVVRLQGPYGGSTWIAPAADGPGDYTTIAAAFQRVVAGLPRRDGHNLFVEVWNEPNLNIEWSGAPNPWAYAHFLLDVSRAIRGLGDSRIVILNGGLAPGGDVNHLDFIDGMATVPGALDSFDVWASHPYPANHPPEYNIHDGTATYTVATIDTYMLELDRLAEHGRPGLHVLLTETGHNLGNNVFGFEGYTPVNEGNRADFMVRAFRDYWSVWPEVVGVTPFELVDPHNHWSAFDWLYPNGAHHQQYDAVAALGKSTKLLPTELTITFRVRASMSPGTYFSRVDASAANATVVGTGNTAAVTVLAPTATATATATGTPTATPTATPSPTATAPPCARYDLDGDGAITVTDIMAVAAAWGTNAGEPGYVPEYDFNTNGQIDVFDIMQVAGHWAETCPPGSGEVRAGAFELRESPGLRALAWDQATNRLLGLSRTDLLVLSDDG
ncbi:MAG: dockerin type I domain-containing protein, partial [Phycisphaerae bacterium]